MTRVVLVDDQALVRGGLRALLEAEDDLEVVGEAADGEAAVATVSGTKPDVVLMDIRMPKMDGLEATRRIAADPALTDVKVLVLTTFEIDEYVFEALRVGASGFLLKDEEPVELLRAVRVVANGDSLLSPSVTRRVVEAFASGPKPNAPALAGLDELTEREREIVALVGTGLSNQEIADHLVISPATARTHVSRAMLKLGPRPRPARRLRLRSRARRARPRREPDTKGGQTPLGSAVAIWLCRRASSRGRPRRSKGGQTPLGYVGGRRGSAAWGPMTDRGGGPTMEA